MYHLITYPSTSTLSLVSILVSLKLHILKWKCDQEEGRDVGKMLAQKLDQVAERGKTTGQAGHIQVMATHTNLSKAPCCSKHTSLAIFNAHSATSS